MAICLNPKPQNWVKLETRDPASGVLVATCYVKFRFQTRDHGDKVQLVIEAPDCVIIGREASTDPQVYPQPSGFDPAGSR